MDKQEHQMPQYLRELEREIQSGQREPKQYIVCTERDGYTTIDDVWADEVEVVDGELRFYRVRRQIAPAGRTLLGRTILKTQESRELIAAYWRSSWDSFGLADDPEGDPNSEYGVIDPRAEAEKEADYDD